MTGYRHRVTVTGKHQFPLDMLRYDCLSPLRTEDVRTIEHAMEQSPNEVVEIKLYRIAERTWKPTTGRWNSFLWAVTEHEVDKA